MSEMLKHEQESQIKSEDIILLDGEEPEEEDSVDDLEEKPDEYKENHWPLPPDEPKGFTFKGKTKLMAKAFEELKKILKKKAKGCIGNTKFSVSDVKKIGSALETIVEITDASGSGKAIINFWGPNTKTKQCTILIKKPKDHDERFVKIVAKEIVQKVLDCVICGNPPDKIFINTSVKEKEKQGNTHECEMCAKTFPAKRYLKSHMTRIHTSNRQYICDICAQSFENELAMKKHKFKCISTSKNIKGSKISMVRKIDDLNSNSDQVKDLDSPHYKKKKNTHDVSVNSKNEDNAMDVDVQNEINCIDNVDTNEVPLNWKPYIFDDELIQKIKPDGACGFRAGAAHIFGDQEYGPKFAIQIYRHIHQYWETYYKKIFSFPYKRQVGVSGQWVEFHEEKDLLEYLKSSPDVSHLWADSQELQAMANIYQIQIKVLSVKVSDQDTPTVLHIGPDNDFKEGAKEPWGKIPNMTLFYIEKSHYDLITSRKRKVTKKIIDGKKFSNELFNLDSDLKKELEEIRIANKKLITVYSASLQKVKNLEDQLKNDISVIENNVVETMTKSKQEESLDDQILLEGKRSGFSRTGPQSQPIAKSKDNKAMQGYKCDVCQKSFDRKEVLEKHEHSHNEDGDWNCDNCGFEANSKQILDKHIKCAHQKSSTIENQIFKNQFSCKFCNMNFRDNQTLLQHRKSMHKTFKPCNNMSDCKFQKDCLYNHSQIEANSFICYECGKLFPVVSDLMSHRMNSHEKPMCKRFLMNACNFATDKCWYSHINNHESVDIEMKSPEKFKKPSSQQNQQVFQESQQILVPPGNNPIQPTMAMWIQMKMKMAELTQMMSSIQQIVQ